MKNVVLVTIDCLRADAVGCYDNSQDTTPTIDDIAERGIRFDTCFATAGSTKFSFPALLGSIYFDMYDGNRFPRSVPLVSEVFADAGYFTAGFNAANPNLTSEFGYHAGFDEFDDFITDHEGDGATNHYVDASEGDDGSEEGGSSDGDSTGVKDVLRTVPPAYSIARFSYQLFRYRLPNPYRKARNYVRYLCGETPNALSNYVTPPASEVVNKGIDAAARAADNGRPFFLWLHLMEPHSWYNPDPEHVEALYGERISRTDRFRANRALMSASPFHGTPDIAAVEDHLDVLLKLYHATVRQADAAIGTLQEWLENNDLAADTSLVITADHGEQFLEHGGVQHGGGVYPELTRVPLVVSDPDVSGDNVSKPCSLIDVPITLTSLANVESPPSYMGRDLSAGLADVDRRPAISVKPGDEQRIAARDERHTLIQSEEHADEFFDRTEDPLELDLLDVQPNRVSHLEAAIRQWRERLASTDIESTTIEPSEAVAQQLEDLGYFE